MRRLVILLLCGCPHKDGTDVGSCTDVAVRAARRTDGWNGTTLEFNRAAFEAAHATCMRDVEAGQTPCVVESQYGRCLMHVGPAGGAR
jgi:hypothetical protein